MDHGGALFRFVMFMGSLGAIIAGLGAKLANLPLPGPVWGPYVLIVGGALMLLVALKTKEPD